METLAIAHRPPAQEEDTSAAARHAGNNSGETFPNFSCLLETPAPSQDAAEWEGVMTQRATGGGEDRAPVKTEPGGNKPSLLKQRDAGVESV